MKHQWLAYVVVAILSIGAGVAIAGMPDSVPESETIIPPSTTVAPEPTLPSTTEPAATTTERPDTEPTDTEPTDTEPTDTAPTDTAIASATSALPERATVTVAVANGSGRAGVAVENRDVLVGLGYANVPALNAEEVVDATTVYYAPGSDAVAERMAADLGLPPEAVAPITTAPGVQDLDVVQLLVYIGADRA
jgi:cytoskeletal protein RodZ